MNRFETDVFLDARSQLYCFEVFIKMFVGNAKRDLAEQLNESTTFFATVCNGGSGCLFVSWSLVRGKSE